MKRKVLSLAVAVALSQAAVTMAVPTVVPGLTVGQLAGNPDEVTPNPANAGYQLGIDYGQTNGKPPWADNSTFVYTGQVFDADGRFAFAENIDDKVRLYIDGVQVINNDTWNQSSTSASTANNSAAGAGTLDFGAGPAGDGWHDFELRMSNGGGGAGAEENDPGDGWFSNAKGFGLNSNPPAGFNSSNGDNYVIPVDNGKANLFRTTINFDPARTGTAGLVEGFLVGDPNLGPNPNAGPYIDPANIKLSPELGYISTKPPWMDNSTVVYTGQFHDADGIFSFGESIDDRVRLYIDGTEVLNNDTWNQTTATGILDMGMGADGKGWHDFELYMSNGGGGAGPVDDGTGWTSTFGFGYNPLGTTSLLGSDYLPLIDPGNASLLRINAPTVPEPATALLGLIGLAALGARRRRKA